MTPISIGRLTPAQQTADAQAPTPEQQKAAQEFEAIFLRQLLSPLEKSSGLAGAQSSGGAVFRSMMIGALADTAAEGGGIGMRELILRAMLPPAPAGGPAPQRPGAALPGAAPALGEPSARALGAGRAARAVGELGQGSAPSGPPLALPERDK